MTDYSTDADVVGDAMDATYENKEVNKKNDISGDYSTDNASYPTVKAVKLLLSSSYLTSSEINTLLSSYVTSTALNTILTDYIQYSDIVDNLTTSDATKVLSAKQGKTLKDTVDLKADKSNGASQITDNNSATYTNIGTLSAGATQQTINNALNTKIGELQSIKAIIITDDKGTATADKMGKLYIVSENNKVNIYYVINTGTSQSPVYDWKKMDADILDELVVNWSDIQNKPTFINQSDIDNSISAFATALAERINPSS